MATERYPVAVYLGQGLADYGFGRGHPFGPDRQAAFERLFRQQGLDQMVDIRNPVGCSDEQILRFHTRRYLEQVKEQSKTGAGYLDFGDTPAFEGVFEAASNVVGSTLDALSRVMSGEYRRAFVPIAGLHHARRDTAAGFCVFNDCGVAIETLRQQYGIQKVAYIDIDAHHGDGVFYEFEQDPQLVFVDFHEDGRFLYPGTGHAHESGKGDAVGTKLNIPMPPHAGDSDFFQRWEQAEPFLTAAKPEFILLQCGVDSLAGDPITSLCFTSAVHGFVAKKLCHLADSFCQGRLVAMGGGGYNRDNLAVAWCAVVKALVNSAN